MYRFNGFRCWLAMQISALAWWVLPRDNWIFWREVYERGYEDVISEYRKSEDVARNSE